jgi:hypothetical protein
MRATVTLQLREKETGAVITSRFARNAVMRGGAGLIAALFSGSGSPITHMAVGTNNAPDPQTFDTVALTVAAEELTGATEAPIPAEGFSSEVDDVRRVVKVRVRGTLPDDAAVGTVREAGLIARTSETEAVLYNRVTFDPIVKGNDHELTLFWEVTFPYGDLQWF